MEISAGKVFFIRLIKAPINIRLQVFRLLIAEINGRERLVGLVWS